MPSLENLSLLMEISGEQSVKQGADSVGNSMLKMRANVQGVAEKVGLGEEVNVGEGVTDGVVVALTVKVGDTVNTLK